MTEEIKKESITPKAEKAATDKKVVTVKDATVETKAKKETAPKAEVKTEAKKETAPKAEVKTEAKKVTAPKAEAKKEAAPKAEAKKEAAPKAKAKVVGKKIKVTLLKSTIGALIKQKRTIEALGLKKIRSFVILEDNACIQGMIFVVKHMVRVEEVK